MDLLEAADPLQRVILIRHEVGELSRTLEQLNQVQGEDHPMPQGHTPSHGRVVKDTAE